MSGYPNKITRNDIGPIFENESKITNPKRELDANTLNLLAWQVSGLNGPAWRGLVIYTMASVGSQPVVRYQWFAWDPNQTLPLMSIVRASTGLHTWALPDAGNGVGIYPDKDGSLKSVTLLGVLPFLQTQYALLANGQIDAGGKTGKVRVFDAGAAGSLTDNAPMVVLGFI